MSTNRPERIDWLFRALLVALALLWLLIPPAKAAALLVAA